MADRIVLTGLAFHGFHGAFPEEAKLGARFEVDVELHFDLPSEDDLSRTVDYSRVYELVRREVTGKRYQLIEALANALAARVLSEQPLVARVTVRVHKPHAPLPGVVKDVFAEVTRDRVTGDRITGDRSARSG